MTYLEFFFIDTGLAWSIMGKRGYLGTVLQCIEPSGFVPLLDRLWEGRCEHDAAQGGNQRRRRSCMIPGRLLGWRPSGWRWSRSASAAQPGPGTGSRATSRRRGPQGVVADHNLNESFSVGEVRVRPKDSADMQKICFKHLSWRINVIYCFRNSANFSSCQCHQA